MTPLQTDAGPVVPHDRAKAGALRLLFAKHDLSFPRVSGHDLRAFNMMRALAQLGHHIGLATVEEPSVRSLAGLCLDWQGTLTDPAHGRFAGAPELTLLQSRFASYFGVSRERMVALGGIAREFQADAIIGMGPDIPPYLAAAGTIPCVWYVGDEWVSHYSSLFKLREVHTWRHLKTAAIWGLYERAFVPDLERIWVVSNREEQQMRRWTSATHVDALPNGVDSDYFAPVQAEERPNTVIFWGRLDFAPNLQALQWFCTTVWPTLRQRFADAEFRIVGFHPGDEARQLAQLPGVVLSPDLEDLRRTVGEHAVVVMPFHSGGGIKNKLLEAASMGKAVVCTAMACGGLRGDPALLVAESPEEWVTAISGLWRDATARAELGLSARDWAIREHSWRRTALDAVRSLNLNARVSVGARGAGSEAPGTVLIPSDAPAGQTRLRLLFAKHDLSFPRSHGHDVHAYNMMRSLAQLGHRIGLATVEEPSARALAGLCLDWHGTLTDPANRLASGAPELTLLQARFASYFGVSRKRMVALGGIAREFQADAIIGLGPDIPPYMAAAGTIPCVWYVGDEWVSHYASLFDRRQVRTWRHLKSAAIWGLYERAFAPRLERIWVVSDREERQMRRWASATRVDALPNGVDADYFAPVQVDERPNTAIFWGRLDFAPNLQALQWFCTTVWPALRQRCTDAEFRIVGFQPGEEAQQLALLPGVVLSANLEDLRPTVGEHAVVVMPFHSGGGIKNKLLEAASMGKAIVCTSMACGGLRGDPALIVVESPEEWVTAITDLWRDQAARQSLGRRAREWTLREHSWGRTAQDAVRTLRLTARV